MIYLLVTYNVIAILCIVYMIFNFMDVVSWLYVKSKTAVLWLWNWLKGLEK